MSKAIWFTDELKQDAEVRRLKRELAMITQGRAGLKRAWPLSASGPKTMDACVRRTRASVP